MVYDGWYFKKLHVEICMHKCNCKLAYQYLSVIIRDMQLDLLAVMFQIIARKPLY